MTSAVRSFGLSLPDYPWEAMAPYLARAAAHPGGAANLSIGTPVDDTPDLIQEALRAAPTPPATRRCTARRRSGKRSRPGLTAAAASPASTRRT